MSEEIYQTAHKNLLTNLLSGNHHKSSSIVMELIEGKYPVIDVYEKVIRKTMYEIGYLWELNKISVASEHLASAIVEAILNEISHKARHDKSREKSILITCLQNEFHQIGIKMIGDVFEMKGWTTFFLGSNTPTKDLIQFAKMSNPDILAVSLSIYFNFPELENMIKDFRKEFPDLLILVGGQAFSRGGLDIIAKYKNVKYIEDTYQVETFIKNYTK